MPSSAPIATGVARASAARPLMSSGAKGCSRNSRPASAVASRKRSAASWENPQLASAQSGMSGPSAPRTACAAATSVASGLTPTLSLKKRMPAALRASASATSCSGVALPTSHMGATAGRTGATDEVDHRHAGRAGGEIEERHLDRGVSAGVAVEHGAHALDERGPHPRVRADQHGSKMVAHGGDEAGDGVAGHGRRRRRFAPADGSVLRLDAHQEIAGMGHRLGRHLDRLGQRQRQRDRIDPADRERRAGEFGSVFGCDLHAWPLDSGPGMLGRGMLGPGMREASDL